VGSERTLAIVRGREGAGLVQGDGVGRRRKKNLRAPAVPVGAVSGERAVRRFWDGVVVVHGVGYRDPWVTLRLVASSLVGAMRAEGLGAEFAEDPAGEVPSGELRVEGARSLLLAEGHWADIVRDRRGGWVRGGLARLRLVIAAFPYLLIAVLSPRGAEAAEAERRTAAGRARRPGEPADGWQATRDHPRDPPHRHHRTGTRGRGNFNPDRVQPHWAS
jgi:hypothetical protein